MEACRKTLIAIGDETRQHIIIEMIRMDPGGGRVQRGDPEEVHRSADRRPGQVRAEALFQNRTGAADLLVYL